MCYIKVKYIEFLKTIQYASRIYKSCAQQYLQNIWNIEQAQLNAYVKCNAFSCLRHTRAATSCVKKVQIKTLEDRMKENCTQKKEWDKSPVRWRMRGREKRGTDLAVLPVEVALPVGGVEVAAARVE